MALDIISYLDAKSNLSNTDLLVKENFSAAEISYILSLESVLEVNKNDLDPTVLIMLTGGIKSLKKHPYLELKAFDSFTPSSKYPSSDTLNALSKINSLVKVMQDNNCSVLKINS